MRLGRRAFLGKAVVIRFVQLGREMAAFLVAIVRVLLPVINRVHAAVLGIKPLERNSLISIEVRRHKGSPIKLRDGCEVTPGDPVIKLHLNNAWIAEKWRTGVGFGGRRFPRGAFHYFKEGMQLLARKVADGEYGDIVAVYGWTAFYTQASRLGFQVIDLPDSLRVKLAWLHITALRQARSIPWLKGRASSRKVSQIKAVWLSRAELLRIQGHNG